MLGFYLTLIDEPSDKEKFTEIYYEYKDMMFYKAMSILHNEALAEEAVQDSFLKIAKNISGISLAVCSKTAAFVVIIIRNTSINILKAEHLNEKEILDDSFEDISRDALREVFSDVGYKTLVDEIAKLDAIYSDILTLKLLYEYDTPQICEILGIQKRTAESRIYRGKNMLKARLEEIINA